MAYYAKSKEKKELTYRYICAFVKKYNYAPSVREICATVGFKSTASAQHYLDLLEEEGFIRRSSTKNRTIEIVDKNFINECEIESDQSNTEKIPYVGNIAAGLPLTAGVVEDQTYNLPSDYFNLQGNCFLLTVKGCSMIDAGILDGDLVLIRQQSNARNGEIIAAQIDNEDVTLKRFFRGDGYIRLHPENSTMQDIIVTPEHEFKILGVITGLLRNRL